jgi:ribosomal-protein-alanine N-acetyltransferase
MIDPSLLQTARLILRPPGQGDAAGIFQRLASDPEATRLVGWPRHTSIEDTHAFLSFSQQQWETWPAGPLLITARGDGRVIGSTGLAFETPYRACTGFVVSREVWGSGFASEALRAVVAVAASLAVRRLYALCHVQHARSVRVLERCEFEPEGILRRYQVFPNLGVPEPQDVYCYARLL